MNVNKRAKMTPELMAEAQRLKAIWDSRKHRTQAEFGEAYDLGNQSNVGHYLNGRIPLNLKAALAFSKELGCDIAEFSHRLAQEPSLPSPTRIVGKNELGVVTSIPPSRYRVAWVVGKGSGGTMPERVWTDGDHPVGATSEYAEIATTDAHAFLSEVVGDSMSPRYMPGEFCLVEPGTEPEIEDDVLVRLDDGQTLLKRLLSRRGGYRLGSYNNAEVLFYPEEKVTWIYYVAHPVPRRKIKSRT